MGFQDARRLTRAASARVCSSAFSFGVQDMLGFAAGGGGGIRSLVWVCRLGSHCALDARCHPQIRNADKLSPSQARCSTKKLDVWILPGLHLRALRSPGVTGPTEVRMLVIERQRLLATSGRESLALNFKSESRRLWL